VIEPRQAKHFGTPRRAAYWFCWALARGLLTVLFRLRVRPPAGPLPRGPFVVAANHCSFLDPVVLGVSLPRRVVYLVSSDVYVPLLRPFFWLFGCIRVDEDRPNIDAVRRALAELRAGHVVGIFPEGGISRDGEPMRGLPGAVSLGLAGGVPIVPVAILGARDALPPGASWPRPRRVTIVFGEPFRVEDLEGGTDRRGRLQVATTAIMERIAELRSRVTG